MDRKIDPKVKIIMNQAIREAKDHDDNKIKPETIIIQLPL